MLQTSRVLFALTLFIQTSTVSMGVPGSLGISATWRLLIVCLEPAHYESLIVCLGPTHYESLSFWLQGFETFYINWICARSAILLPFLRYLMLLFWVCFLILWDFLPLSHYILPFSAFITQKITGMHPYWLLLQGNSNRGLPTRVLVDRVRVVESPETSSLFRASRPVVSSHDLWVLFLT